MATDSNPPSNSEAAVRRQRNGPPFKFLVPLIYAPVLPLIRLSLRKNPVVRDRLFTLVLAGAFAHGMYLVYIRLREQVTADEDQQEIDSLHSTLLQ